MPGVTNHCIGMHQLQLQLYFVRMTAQQMELDASTFAIITLVGCIFAAAKAATIELGC